MEFKKGDKVKIPTTKSYGDKIELFHRGMEGYKKNYLIIEKIEPRFISLARVDGKYLTASLFLPSDLSLYEEVEYRFITKEEMKKLCGDGTSPEQAGVNLIPAMEFMLGKRVPKSFYDRVMGQQSAYITQRIFESIPDQKWGSSTGSWNIEKWMLTGKTKKEMKKTIYRFKTEQELIDTLGDWKNEVRAGYVTQMDNHLGEEIDESFYNEIITAEGNTYFNKGGYYVASDMVTAENVTVKEKKITGWKTLKDIPGVPSGTSLKRDGEYWGSKEGEGAWGESYLEEYPDFFEPQYEEDIAVGDLIQRDGVFGLISKIDDTGYWVKHHSNGVLTQDTKWFTKESKTKYRKATEEETALYKKRIDLAIANYMPYYNEKDKSVYFGCKGFTEEEVEGIYKLSTVARSSGLNFRLDDVELSSSFMYRLLDLFPKK